jgi:hypothetical protein
MLLSRLDEPVIRLSTMKDYICANCGEPAEREEPENEMTAAMVEAADASVLVTCGACYETLQAEWAAS